MLKLTAWIAVIIASHSSFSNESFSNESLPILAAPPTQATDAADVPGLMLAYFGGLELPAGALERVGPELDDVFVGVPIALEWVDGTSIRPPASPVLRVILIDRVPTEWGLAPNVLGAVVGAELPPSVIYVFHRNVLRELNLDAASHSFAPDVARAIARVVAHELVHAFAPRHRHRPMGLMASGLGRDALARRPARIDPECAAALVRGLLASHPPAGDE